MGARWPLAQGGRVGSAGETSVFCPPTQPCRKLVVFVFGEEVRGAHLLSGAEARSSYPRVEEKEQETALLEPEDTSARTQVPSVCFFLLFRLKFFFVARHLAGPTCRRRRPRSAQSRHCKRRGRQKKAPIQESGSSSESDRDFYGQCSWIFVSRVDASCGSVVRPFMSCEIKSSLRV